MKENITARKWPTTNERAARWYKTEVTSTKKQKKLKISTAADQGGFKFTIYQSGKKKPIKTVKTSVKHLDKTVKLPKKKGTYYVKVSTTKLKNKNRKGKRNCLTAWAVPFLMQINPLEISRFSI